MKTTILGGLAFAAALLVAGPVFADGHYYGGARGGAYTGGYVSRGGGTGGSRAGVAFGGTRLHYAFGAQPGWNPNHDYLWNGNRYHWYYNGWYIVDTDPGYYGYGNPYYGDYGTAEDQYNTGDQSGDALSEQVQAVLAQEGYYNGPVDGVLGPRSHTAIASYQRDHGMPETGQINGGLIASMGIRPSGS